MDVFSQQSGPFQWRVKDCLTTASLVIKSYNCIPPNYSSWHVYSNENKATIMARKKYGTLYRGHLNMFKEVGLSMYTSMTTHTIKIGDICLLGGIITDTRTGIIWDTEKHGTQLGFVGNGYDIWTWFKTGLSPVYVKCIEGVIRCHP